MDKSKQDKATLYMLVQKLSHCQCRRRRQRDVRGCGGTGASRSHRIDLKACEFWRLAGKYGHICLYARYHPFFKNDKRPGRLGF